jgi:hypothetical protein
LSGSAFWVTAAIGLILIAVSPPGGENTVDDAKRVDPLPTPPQSHIERLCQSWDSDSTADWPVAETLALMSEAAYSSPIDAKTCFSEMGFGPIDTVVDGTMIGYIVPHHEVTVIVFRGTDASEVSDWLVDLNERTVRTPHGPMHRGFSKAYEQLKPQINKTLVQNPPKRLWITGHSLGGALALVCAHDLSESGQFIYGVITFGQPMIATEQLAKYLHKQLSRRYAHYANDDDIVTRVPPPPYSHCGSLVWFTKDGIKRSEKTLLAQAAPGAKEPSDEIDDLTPVSEREFRELKARLQREKNAKPKLGPDGRPLCEGNLPLLEHHAMKNYIDKIRGVHKKEGEKLP